MAGIDVTILEIVFDARISTTRGVTRKRDRVRGRHPRMSDRYRTSHVRLVPKVSTVAGIGGFAIIVPNCRRFWALGVLWHVKLRTVTGIREATRRGTKPFHKNPLRLCSTTAEVRRFHPKTKHVCGVALLTVASFTLLLQAYVLSGCTDFWCWRLSWILPRAASRCCLNSCLNWQRPMLS